MKSEKYKNIIGIDWQCWPIYKLTLRDILLQLGAKIVDDRIGFNIDDQILNIFPVKLEDDGMGYGINPQFITCADYYNLENKSGINFWAETQHPQEEIDSFVKESKELEQQILAKINN